jgi:hypothetical protein
VIKCTPRYLIGGASLLAYGAKTKSATLPVTPRFYKKRKWKFFEFSHDITNLSELNIGNGLYMDIIQIWELNDTSELLLKYLKIDIVSQAV